MLEKDLVYIASGMAYSRIVLSDVINSAEIRGRVKELYSQLRGFQGHDFGMLFNGWAEKRIGAILKEQYSDVIREIHADSGGLQVITRGVTLNDQVKDGVYKTQAACSDIAMCFDEIPVRTNIKSSRNDNSNRFFIPEELEGKARLTGKNVKRQIEVFLETETKARPCLIIQGNDYDTYMRWTEYCLEEIPKEHHKYICGVAMGGAALGTGFLEDIKRAMYFRQLPIETENNYLHILGVGAVNRLIPYLIFGHSGYYKPDTLISYDSTTHTSGVDLGQYYSLKDVSTLQFTRAFTNAYIQINEEIKANTPGYEYTAHQLHHSLNSNLSTYTKDVSDFVYLRNAFLTSSIKNFMTVVNDIKDNEESLVMRSENVRGGGGSLRALFSVTNRTDFEAWLREYGKYIPSKPVNLEGQTVSLDDFL